MKHILTTFSALAIAVFTAMSIYITGFAGIPSWPTQESSLGYFFVSTNPFGTAVYQKYKQASTQFNGYSLTSVGQKQVTLTPKNTSAQSIEFNRDDILFDSDGTLYTEPQTEQITELEKQVQKRFKKYASDERDIPFAKSTLYLINPNIPGILAITTADGNTVSIHRDQKRIVGLKASESLTVTAYDALSEITL